VKHFAISEQVHSLLYEGGKCIREAENKIHAKHGYHGNDSEGNV
jgi:hypothetical protein